MSFRAIDGFSPGGHDIFGWMESRRNNSVGKRRLDQQTHAG